MQTFWLLVLLWNNLCITRVLLISPCGMYYCTSTWSAYCTSHVGVFHGWSQLWVKWVVVCLWNSSNCDRFGWLFLLLSTMVDRQCLSLFYSNNKTTAVSIRTLRVVQLLIWSKITRWRYLDSDCWTNRFKLPSSFLPLSLESRVPESRKPQENGLVNITIYNRWFPRARCYTNCRMKILLWSDNK